ncbi:MAG TPA: OsmC family protein [Thermoanaerobaculia bacterium]|nr:OsmC family protein [Thermoanaerobaculia bacterium]
MKIETRFPGGVRVDAVVRGFTVPTDQPFENGGFDTAPSPYELFLASLTACAGLYAVQFCRKRGISTDGLRLSAVASKEAESHLMDSIRIDLELPHGFPEQYRAAILRSIDQCAIKRALENPPKVESRIAGESVVAA